MGVVVEVMTVFVEGRELLEPHIRSGDPSGTEPVDRVPHHFGRSAHQRETSMQRSAIGGGIPDQALPARVAGIVQTTGVYVNQGRADRFFSSRFS